jgi:hypothetical protein
MPHTVKEGDTPTLRWRLEADGQAVDLTGWECRLLVRPRNSETLAINAVLSGGTPGGGIVEYKLGASELPRGFYDAEIQATSGATVLTYPEDTFDTINVEGDLGPPAP